MPLAGTYSSGVFQAQGKEVGYYEAGRTGGLGGVGAKPRFVYLDGLRGMAALMVVVYHLWIWAGSPDWPVPLGSRVMVDLLSPVGALGGSRVSLFFVLSGALLYLPFARRDRQRQDVPEGTPTEQTTLAGWLWRRFRRLAPPYYAALPLALLPFVATFYLGEAWRVGVQHLPPRVPHFGSLFDAFPACLVFLHGIVPGSEAPAFNGPLWTLTPEVQLYVSFPLLVALTRCRMRVGKWTVGGVGFTVTLAFVASIAYRVWLYRQIGFAVWQGDNALLHSQYHCLVNTFLGRWAEFALGIGTAEAILRAQRRDPRVLLLASLSCLVWFLILRSDLAIGGWVGAAFLAMEPAPSPLADAVGGVAFALLILCCAASLRFTRFFTWRPLVSLGTFAYSLYLIHIPLLLCLHRVTNLLLHVDLTTPVSKAAKLGVFTFYLLFVLPLTLLVARLFWLLLERPFLSPERRLTLNRQVSTTQNQPG